jgi:hypothetical protein
MFKKLSDVLDFSSHKRSSSKTNYKKTSSFNFLALIYKWPDIIGEKLSNVTVPIKAQNNSLTILTSHPAYSQSLSFLESTLKIKIYKEFPELEGKIKQFYFQVNTKYFEEEKQKIVARSEQWAKGHQSTETQNKKKQSFFHPYNPKYIELKQEALEHFSSLIDDEETLETMVSLYIQARVKDL